MAKHLFNLSCPRCDTSLRIYSSKNEYQCSRCNFKIFIDDSHNLLDDYNSKKIDDLDVHENSISEIIDGKRKEGLSLSFSEIKEDDDKISENDTQEDIQVDNDDGKSSHTQVINLTFDPTKILEEYTSNRKHSKSSISLNQMISNAQHARPPVNNTNRNLLIGGIIVAFLTFIILFILSVK